jgi:hypothetical protein
MRFSDFLLVSDPGDLDFIVGYTEEQNIRISVSDIFDGYIKGSGNPGYVPVFTSNNSIGNSQIFQDGSNIVIGGVNAMGYRLAVGGTIYAFNGAVIETTSSGADALRVISEGENIFIIPNDLGQSITSSRRIIHPPAVLTTESATLGQLNAAISNLDAEIDILLALKVDKTSVGVANGVASLDAGGKVPLSQIPDSIIGQVQYMGTWNALTNTPTLNFLVPEEKGHYYVVSVAGVFGGIDFQVGDWIISNGTYWEKVDNTDAVTSVFGRIGAILPLEADYQSFYPRLSQAYDNPTWINSLAFSKITGVPPFLLENQTITLSGDVTGSGKTSIPTTISNNAVSNEKLRDSVGTSVIGRSVFSTGDPADIQANSDGHVLLRSAGNLLFGLISSDSISSINWSKITGTPTTLSGYGITDAYTKTEADNKFVPYTGASANVNLGSNNINANSFIKVGGTSSQFLKADGSVDASQYVPTTRSINAGTGLTGGGNLSSDVNISFDTTWGDTRYAYRTRNLTINGTTYDLSADRTWNVGTVTSVGLSMPSAFTVSNSPVNGSGTLTVVGAGTTADYIRGDGSLAAFPSLTGYVPYTGATQDVNLGTYGLTSDFVRFNTTNTSIPSAEGVMWWDNTDGTVRLSVQGNIYSVPIGQSVISKVRNNTDVNLLRANYQAVKISGAQGQRLAVTLAQANNDLNSASTLGLVCENISKNQEGFVINIGQIININTTGNLQGETWNDGDVLYLSPTIAGAITNVKPVAPQHTVIIGYVEYAHQNNGKIYVKIDNGYELEELHDVSAEPFVNNGLLYRDTTLNLWKSATISTILGYTPAPQGNYITALTGEVTASGPGSVVATLSNSAVTGKVLTGLNIAGNEILSTDSILTAFGKLQHQVNQLVGGLQYEGTWNASTNTPTITSSVGTDGTFYIVNVAGTTNINGINDWQVGDWIVFHDTAWQKVDNSDSVSSVFGRVGNIVANQSDYSAFYPLIADIKNGVLTVQGTGVLSGSGTFSANQATNNTITLTHSSISRTDTTSAQTPSFGGSFNVVDSVTSSTEGHITAIDTKTVTIPSTVATSTQTGLLSNADWITFNGKQNTITLTTTGTSGAATLIGSTLNIPNYAPDLSGYVTLATDQTITGLKTIVRGGDVLNFKIGTDTLYGLRVAYNQNELVPSGEATWSFVNTFNRNGSGFETTPISFFRGVLVTGERLLSASINANLLDYYGNNPSGRYPVYTYNTGVQQFSTGIIVGKTTGVVNAATGAISDLPSGVVANFNGRVIGSNAVNSNEFVALGQLGSYVPTSRTLTINGVSYDLSADRSWTITAGVSSVTASSPLFSSGGSTPNITIQQATASQNGFLSSSDWTTFNSKANANGSNASGTWGINITGNAETVDGFSASQSNVANNIVVRDSSGYIFGSYINMTDDGNPGAGTSITSFITKQGDNYYRSVSPTNAMSSIRSVASGSWGINITGNATYALNSTRLYASDPPYTYGGSSPYYMYMNYDGGSYWELKVSPATPGTVRVAYSNISGSSGSATNLYGPGGSYIQNTSTGTSYQYNYQVRENVGGYGSTNETYAPQLAFHWAGIVASSIMMESSGRIAIRNNPGTGYENFIANNVWATTALRSPIFYDENNTAYYVDPASGSRMNSITYDNLYFSGDTSYGFLGRNVYADTVNGRGSDPLELNYYDGGEVHIGAGYSKTLRAGALYTNGAVYGSIFYDSQNTAYYVDPNSTSVFSNVQAIKTYQTERYLDVPGSNDGSYRWVRFPMGWFNGGGMSAEIAISRSINDNGNSPYGGCTSRFIINSREWHSGQDNMWYFYTEHGANNAANGAYGYYIYQAGPRDLASGGYWFYMRLLSGVRYRMSVSADMNFNGNQMGGPEYDVADPGGIQRITLGSGVIGSNGNYNRLSSQYGFYGSDVRTPIYYDLDDTFYLIDPNSDSRLLRLGIGGITPDVRLSVSGDTHISSTLYMGGTAGNYNSWGSRTYMSGGNYYVNASRHEWNNVGYGSTWSFVVDGGDSYITNSSRAPIFYDSNNTGYYVDPASTSNLNQVNLQGFLRRNTSAAGYLEGNYATSINGNSSAAIYTIGGPYQPGTDSLGNMYGCGYTVGNGTSNPGLGMGGWGLYVASGGTSRIFLDSDSGVGISTNSWRAPIFYDSNNTSFYVDPASTSVLNGLTIGGRTALNTAYYPFHSNRDFPSGTLVQTNINYSVSEGDPFILEITGNAYGALIPFDIQVQGYIYANTIINAAGISNGTNISGVRAINFNGNLCFWWPYQSYWQGFNIKVYSAYATYPENRVTSISNSGQPTTSKQYDFAIYQSFHTGNISLFSSYDVTFNRAYSNTDMRAPIFYDSGDTSYYADLNSDSRLLRLGLGGATASGFNLNITGNAQIVRSSTSTALIVGLSGVTGSVIRFSYNGGFVGSISTDGSNTAYNTSSDYRLKEDLKPIDSPLEKVLNLNPLNFKYKSSGIRQDGFIAHELQEILPYIVTGEKDAVDEFGDPVYQEVDYSKLTPILIAAIKELKKEIDTLKTN